MQYFVTVGIPFYNAEKYLEDAIQSVINQSLKNWKLILVDDGSTDRSLTIAKKFENHPNVTVISDGVQKALSARLNEITALANTQFIARMDADDIMHPLRLQKQIEFLRDNPQIDLVGTRIVSIDDNNIPYTERGNTRVPTSKKDILKSSIFNHATVTGRKEWFVNNPYSNKYGALIKGVYNRLEDYELWYRTYNSSSFFILEECLLFYREVNISFLQKYLKTNISMRQFFFEHKNDIGALLYLQLLLLSYFKDLIYRIFAYAGKENILILKRGRRLSRDEKIKAVCLINQAVRKSYEFPK